MHGVRMRAKSPRAFYFRHINTGHRTRKLDRKGRKAFVRIDSASGGNRAQARAGFQFHIRLAEDPCAGVLIYRNSPCQLANAVPSLGVDSDTLRELSRARQYCVDASHPQHAVRTYVRLVDHRRILARLSYPEQSPQPEPFVIERAVEIVTRDTERPAGAAEQHVDGLIRQDKFRSH